MSKASAQVQVRASEDRINLLSSDFEGQDDEDANEVLDMMQSGMAAPARLRHLETISAREFPYEEMEMTGIDPEGQPYQYTNRGRSLEYEKFMEDPIVFKIHATTDKLASPIVYVAINGDERWIPRNVKVRLPRKFVERLAQSSERSYQTAEKASSETDNQRPATSVSTQAYPFSILHDPCQNPKLARRWFARVTKQGT